MALQESTDGELSKFKYALLPHICPTTENFSAFQQTLASYPNLWTINCLMEIYAFLTRAYQSCLQLLSDVKQLFFYGQMN